ncbi:MAG TPA: nuclear transport factor 2 family protein [Steroidobacteraceae bacterium]|nr:nuclear transport factor 2 family protein [Steroidobacteraceae bacterium]
MGSQRGNRVEAARGFLAAYWRADLAMALGFCAPSAVIVLARSLPITTPAPVGEVLPVIFREVYPRFEDGRFDVAIDRTLADGDTVLVEYTARGRLVTGARFECDYAAVLDFAEGKIVRVKMYTDTRYLAAALKP